MRLIFAGLELEVQAESSQAAGTGYVLHGGTVQLTQPEAPARFFRHGWQSWSLASWLELDKPPVPIQPPGRRPQADDPVYALSPRHGGSALGAVECPDGKVLLLGALAPGGRVEAHGRALRGFYESGAGDWFVAHGEEAAAFAHYAEMLAERLGQRGQSPAPRVWCSWYSFYTGISEPVIHQVLEGLQGLPFEVFQLDDGWQQDMGDWEANEKFPSGMQALARRIRAMGYTPGLWMAPFIVRPSSRLYRERPDWLLKDAQGEPVPAGINWGGFYYALDTTHPQVQAWLRGVIQRAVAWGYTYLKLDFLYAAALPGVRQQNIPREQAYREAMRLVREAAGEETYILACGAPVLPSLGLVDGLRIGPDVAPLWRNEDREDYLHDLTGPGGLNALRTSLHRLWLRRLVQTDPDVAYFRTRYNLLSPPQRQALQDLAKIAGFLATSDPPQWLEPDERQALERWLSEEVAVSQIGRYRFLLGEREVDFGEWLGGRDA